MDLKLRGENMVKNVQKDRKKMYEEMIILEKDAQVAQEDLLNEIKHFFTKKMDKEVADHTKITLTYGGYIQIRTVQELSEETLDEFKEEFNFTTTWFREEEMIDYRNTETVSVVIYEYAFIPTNINKILGDNQIDLNEEKI